MAQKKSKTVSPTFDIPDQRIAQRAYERWLARGCPLSDGREDWFAARAELEWELAKRPTLVRQSA